MQRDIRATKVFQEANRLFEEIYRPGTSYLSDMADLQLSVDASRLLFVGTVVESLDEPTTTRICDLDLETGSVRTLTDGPNSDRHARMSPDRRTIAFLSDRVKASDFQLFFLDVPTHVVTAGPAVDGWVEYLQWSPSGRRLLLGVADHGAELPSGQGAYKTVEVASDVPDWMPRVSGASAVCSRRSAWIYDVDTTTMSPASDEPANIWEATWCGDDRLAIVVSDQPEEGAWYGATLSIVDLTAGTTQCLYRPTAQIALPTASPSGRFVAFIEAISSDREYVAGNVRLYDLNDGTCRILDTHDVDTTCIEWRSGDELLVAGHRGLETVVLRVGVGADAVREIWSSASVTTSGRYASVIGLDQPWDFAFVCESFFRRTQIATVRNGALAIVPTPNDDPDGHDQSGDAEAVAWQAPDGLPMSGWLLRPRSEPPYALIMEVHGGPILHWRPYWLGRAASTLMLLRRGYAIFLPNPRGSSGRGQAFAAHVVGDVGGADTADYLSGIDHLVGVGIADPSRLGVTGLSYGGYMTCWLTTQDPRFGAAMSVGPATNHVSHHLSCNIPQFVSLFVQDHYTDLTGRYYSRSPVLHAHKSRTPTLLVAGDLDRCTPPEEAVQFHNALLENGVDAVLVRYPQEGHGIHALPAAMDFAARCTMWFERYIPAVPGVQA